MDPVVALYQSVKEKFPALSVRADAFHKTRWEDMLDIGAEYAWFEALADALNDEMRRGIPYQTHKALFEYIAGAYTAGSTAVKQCIDVSFVENLFWQIPSERCAPYWKAVPSAIKELYLDFHHREP
ncbi:hypothetical protein [Rhizobacter sp. Root1221]|uniref:DUF7674 family protein n=1 Tax=Rhizobacter sp. Root1221 TaxID=1736433 RepID=UPI0006FB8A52|nr:hypothetical protein [Rhizobacter sp. Root1221]KQV94560.1 hypothetical protein ASC87_26035 [Rhizobacter sp. Root1221]